MALKATPASALVSTITPGGNASRLFLRGLGSLGRNGLGSGSGSGRGRFSHGFYHRGSFLGRFGFNRCGNGGFLRCGFGFLRGVLAAAAHDDVALRTGALRINLFLFGKVVAQASGLL